jgi:hypothetical protein
MAIYANVEFSALKGSCYVNFNFLFLAKFCRKTMPFFFSFLFKASMQVKRLKNTMANNG